MFILNLRRSLPRCAYCHEALEAGLTCAACHVALHSECRAELSRCPTLGCMCNQLLALGAKLLRPSPKAIAKFLADTRVETVTETVVGLFLGLIFACFVSLVAMSETRNKRGQVSPPNPAAAVFAWVVTGAAGTALVVVQRRHLRAVHRLLLTDTMREARLLLISQKQQVKGGTRTVYTAKVTENGRKTMKLELGESAKWLEAWCIEQEIGIFSERSGPVVLCHGDDLRVVRPFFVTRT